MELAKAKSKKRSKRNEEQHELPSLERIPIEDVQVINKQHREVDTHKVAGVAASMAMIGLRTPITVRRIDRMIAVSRRRPRRSGSPVMRSAGL
jgi:hypothetical protein